MALPRNEAVDFLANRKSVPLTQIKGPGPDDDAIAEMLEIAARVPDHGRLEPWRFIIYREEAGTEIGRELEALRRKREPGLPETEYERDLNRLKRAPVAIGVVSTKKPHEKIPEWEQFLSAGALAMNLVAVATAAGFAANWVTGWFCDDEEGRAILGLDRTELMAGIVHIGSCDVKIPDRPRPDVAALTSHYSGRIPTQGVV